MRLLIMFAPITLIFINDSHDGNNYELLLQIIRQIK